MPEARIRIALAMTALLMVVEFTAGLWARSIALTSDAGHLLADVGTLTLALIAQRFAARKATRSWTYGFHRAEILAAGINGMALAGTAVAVLDAAWGRLEHPVMVRGEIVSAVGAVGLAVNLVTASVLGSGHGHNLNTRAALLHVVTDAIGSFVAIASGLLAWRFGLVRADPALSFAMAALILWGAWSVLRRAAGILMEGTPTGLDLVELASTIRATPGVRDFHDLHAWTIAEGFDSITVHVVLDGSRHGTDVAREVGERIHAVHRVAHVTVQPEAPALPSHLLPVRSLLDRPRRG